MMFVKNYKIHQSRRIMTDEFRGSPYKGVTRNGAHWQVIQNIDHERFYLGGIKNIKLAALISDIVMIQHKGI